MLRNVKDLRGFAIHATDGVLGEVEDLYFDDENWAIRYLVVETGTWLSGRKVLISLRSLGPPDWQNRQLPVTLSMTQVRHSPDIDTRKPVSRQQEAMFLGHYRYSPYWGFAGLWGIGAYPGGPTTAKRFGQEATAGSDAGNEAPEDSHLRSCNVVIGYHVHATDGDIGHVQDLLVDDRSWAIRYLIVDTSNWWGGHQVLIARQWITAVSWSESNVSIDLNRRAIEEAPFYDAARPLESEQEELLHAHYRRPEYRNSGDKPAGPAAPPA